MEITRRITKKAGKKNLRKRAIITIKIFCSAFTNDTATTRKKAKPLVFSPHNRQFQEKKKNKPPVVCKEMEGHCHTSLSAGEGAL